MPLYCWPISFVKHRYLFSCVQIWGPLRPRGLFFHSSRAKSHYSWTLVYVISGRKCVPSYALWMYWFWIVKAKIDLIVLDKNLGPRHWEDFQKKIQRVPSIICCNFLAGCLFLSWSSKKSCWIHIFHFISSRHTSFSTSERKAFIKLSVRKIQIRLITALKDSKPLAFI